MRPWSEIGGVGAPLGPRRQPTVLALSVHTFGLYADHTAPHWYLPVGLVDGIYIAIWAGGKSMAPGENLQAEGQWGVLSTTTVRRVQSP